MNYLWDCVLILLKSLMIKYVIIVPKLAPRVSIRTSRNWAERPGTKIWWSSSVQAYRKLKRILITSGRSIRSLGVFLRLIKKRLPRMAYSVKWAVFRTRKIKVLRLIKLFSRPWRTCGKFWAIKSTKRLLWASEELCPKEDIIKMKHIWKISSVGRMRRRILIVIRTILSFRGIFLELELDYSVRCSWNWN